LPIIRHLLWNSNFHNHIPYPEPNKFSPSHPTFLIRSFQYYSLLYLFVFDKNCLRFSYLQCVIHASPMSLPLILSPNRIWFSLYKIVSCSLGNFLKPLLFGLYVPFLKPLNNFKLNCVLYQLFTQER